MAQAISQVQQTHADTVILDGIQRRVWPVYQGIRLMISVLCAKVTDLDMCANLDIHINYRMALVFNVRHTVIALQDSIVQIMCVRHVTTAKVVDALGVPTEAVGAIAKMVGVTNTLVLIWAQTEMDVVRALVSKAH